MTVTKEKFETAGRRLEAAQMGVFGYISGKALGYFLKKTPEGIRPFLLMEDYRDLCTMVEYSERYRLAPPASITDNMKRSLIYQGLVPTEFFGSSPEVSLHLEV